MAEDEAAIRVVHIDDEPDFARLTARHLEREHERISVQTATTGSEGLSLVTADTDCVISDYDIGETTGLTLFEEVREQHPDIPFILFTDTGNERIASRAISAGVTDYLIKGVVSEQYSLLARKIITSVERRRAEQQAERTHRQLAEIADQTDDVLWMFSADWSELTFINAAYEDVFDQPTDRAIEDPSAFLSAVHPQDRDKVTLAMDRVSNGDAVDLEYRLDTDQNGAQWVSSSAKPVFEDGEVVRVVGFTRDITQRKQSEQQLKAKNEQLERFASVVAHDLRNPWNVADGFLRLARESQDSDDLRRVADALDRMERIITDLLALAKAGAQIDHKEPVSVAEVAESSWDLISHPEGSLTVAGDTTVIGDPTRIAQLFENLFRNSVEHAGPAVTIVVGSLAEMPGFYIEDDGPGIPESDREAVFDRGHTTTRTGTGFGLAIVEDIVTAHNWTLTLTESADGGARFEISGVERQSA